MKWDKHDIKFLEENYAKRIPLKQISNKLNKTVRAIQHKASRLGLSRPKYKFNIAKKEPRKIIEKRYYEKNKKQIYGRKKKRIQEFKEELVKNLGGKCQRCSYNKCIAALEFHHNKGKKENAIKHMINNYSKEKTLKEVSKCILLCANCHREVHKGL